MSEEISEACGVFGAVCTSGEPVFPHLYWGLLSLNHRGQQSYGFTTLHDGKFIKREDLNLIPTDPREIEKLSRALKGTVGISNARYATSGRSGKKHLQGGKQPFVVSHRGKSITISYNGNIVTTDKFRDSLRKKFGRFNSDADTEVLAKQILSDLEETGSYESAIGRVLDEVEGAYSVMILDSDGSFYAFRDVHGIKPYCFAQKEGVVAFASETPALDINGFNKYSYVNPGELVSVSSDGKVDRKQLRKPSPALCSFEFAYFSRPDAILNDTNLPVYKIREAFARQLSETYGERLKNNELILSIPETADDAAYGLHDVTGLPWERAVRKNRYVTRRAFISGTGDRMDVIDKKMNIVTQLVKDKSIAVIEDSIVRGDTTRINVDKLRKSGAKRVDVYVTFPQIRNPCFYGVDMSTYGELLGANKTPEEISKWIGADSVNFQNIEGLVRAIGLDRDSLCTACMTGKYPTPEAQRVADEIRAKYLSGESDQGKRIYEKRSKD